jgi:hypothetical protein
MNPLSAKSTSLYSTFNGKNYKMQHYRQQEKVKEASVTDEAEGGIRRNFLHL